MWEVLGVCAWSWSVWECKVGVTAAMAMGLTAGRVGGVGGVGVRR